MKKTRDTVAVICEYDPFHRGHERLLSLARELHPECDIISVMSGNTVQRGDLALYDRYVRAEAAAVCGCSLVLELPYPYSCASAEQFAAAGVYIAAEAGAQYLVFGYGAESAEELFDAAKVLSDEEFTNALLCAAKEHPRRSFLKIRESLYRERTGKSLPTDGNSSLGIEYIIAAERLNTQRAAQGKARIICQPIKRRGDFSATLCRSRIRSSPRSPLSVCYGAERGNSPINAPIFSDNIFADIPTDALPIFDGAKIGGGIRHISSVILAALRSQYLSRTSNYTLALADQAAARGNSPKYPKLHRDLAVEAIPKERQSSGGDRGIRDALLNASVKARNIEELEAAFPTATYTRARIRRELLDAVLLPELPEKDLRDAIRSTTPQYTVLLSASDNGLSLLAKMRRRSSLTVITKPSDCNKLSNLGKALYALGERAEALFALSFSPPLSPTELIPRFKHQRERN